MSIVKRHSPLVIVLLAGAALSLAACTEENPTRAAIRKASTELGAVSSGASTATTNAHQQKLFDDASKSALAAGGSGASAAAANLISSTAAEGKAGVSDGAARTASGGAELSENASDWKVTEVGIYNRMSSLRSHLSQYVNHKQTASAAALFNPAEQLAALDKTSATLDQANTERAQARVALEEQIASLTSTVKQKNEAAGKLDAKAGELRNSISSMTATAAAPVVEQAAGFKRQADRLRQDAQLVEADATQLRSQLPELQLAIAQIDSQKKGIAQTKADFAEKLAFNAAQATRSNADAAKIVAAIEEEVADLKKVREGAWTTANDGRLSLLRQGLGTAQKANADAPVQSKLTVGSVQQAIGDVQLSRAVEARACSQLMEMLATSNPALPKAADYKNDADNAAKARDEFVTAAKEAYEAAKSAYATAPVKGSKDSADVKARLEKLGTSLDAVIQALSSGSNASLKEFGYSDAPVIPAGKTEAPADKAAPAAAGNPAPAELIAAVDAFLAAGKAADVAKMTALCKASSPLAQQMIGITMSMSKLDAACKAKFGKSFSESMKGMPGMQMGTDFSADGVSASSLKFNMTGEGSATTNVGGAPLAFVKDGADWKFDMDSVAEKVGANPMAAGMLAKAGPAFDSLAQDVADGKIGDAGALQAQLMAKLMGGAGGFPAVPDK